MRELHVAVTHDHVFRRGIEPPRILIAPGFHGKAVIGVVERAVFNEHAARHVDIESVVVVFAGTQVEIAGDHVFAQIDMDAPERAIAQGEAVEEHVAAAVHLNELRPEFRIGTGLKKVARRHRRIGRAPQVLRKPGFLHRRTAFCVFRRPLLGFGARIPALNPGCKRSRSRDRHVLALVGIDERRSVPAFDAFPRRMDGRQIIGLLVGKLQNRAFFKMQIHVAAEMDLAGKKLSLRHDHISAAGRVTRRHRLGDSLRAFASAGDRAEIGDRKATLRIDILFERRHFKRLAGDFNRLVFPALRFGKKLLHLPPPDTVARLVRMQTVRQERLGSPLEPGSQIKPEHLPAVGNRCDYPVHILVLERLEIVVGIDLVKRRPRIGARQKRHEKNLRLRLLLPDDFNESLDVGGDFLDRIVGPVVAADENGNVFRLISV